MKIRIKKALYPKNEIHWSKKYRYGHVYFKGYLITLKL